MNVSDSHIRMLREQNAALLAENEQLKRKLAAWPARALEHAIKARQSERGRLNGPLRVPITQEHAECMARLEDEG